MVNKNILLLIVVVFLVVAGEGVSAATKVFEYGFEDYSGDPATTLGYPFDTSYWFISHIQGSEVVTSCESWTPHTSNYFYIENVYDDNIDNTPSGQIIGADETEADGVDVVTDGTYDMADCARENDYDASLCTGPGTPALCCTGAYPGDLNIGCALDANLEVGMPVTNNADGGTCTITAVSGNTFTCPLVGGDGEWNVGDEYIVNRTVWGYDACLGDYPRGPSYQNLGLNDIISYPPYPPYGDQIVFLDEFANEGGSEIFLRYWIIHNPAWHTATDQCYKTMHYSNKFIRLYRDPGNTQTDSTYFTNRFGWPADGENCRYYFAASTQGLGNIDSGSVPGAKITCQDAGIDLWDGNWHSVSFYSKLQDTLGTGNGILKVWLDQWGNETSENALITWAVPYGTSTTQQYYYVDFNVNFVVYAPNRLMRVGYDDFEIWDGIPTSQPECDDTIDNDGDGAIDFSGGDTGCDDANDDDESNCGDLVCEGGETCLTCVSDCGICPSACSPADSNTDGSISITEIMNYITQWKAGSVTISELMTGIGEWKNGC